MKVTQIAQVLNSTIEKEVVGEVDLIQEDLSNIVDVGKVVTNALTAEGNTNKFVETLIDRVGRVKYVDRTYVTQAPNILKDSYEYGSILMKVRAEVPDFQENTSWKLGDLKGKGINEASELDPFVISAPTAIQKVYNSKVTYEAPITISDLMLKQAFTSASEMGRFIAMIENRIQLKMTLSTDALIMRTINNLIGLKIAGGKNVVNLLEEYNAVATTPITSAQKALCSTEFLRFATKTIALYKDYLKTASVKYNDSGNYITFTPSDRLKFVALSEFAKDMETYLYADTYHNEFVKMDGYSTVPFWQTQGKDDDDFILRSSLAITASDGTDDGVEVSQTGIVAIMFDEEAAAVVNENYRVTSQYNPRGEYTNYFYKWDAGYMNDTFENCVVFVVAGDEDAVPANFNVAGKTGSLWDVTISNYQSNISVSGNKITGTLTKDNATDAWTTKWGKGYFLALQFSGSNAVAGKTEVGLFPSEGAGFVALDSDKDALFKITDKDNQRLAVRINGEYFFYDLSGLTLA